MVEKGEKERIRGERQGNEWEGDGKKEEIKVEKEHR